MSQNNFSSDITNNTSHAQSQKKSTESVEIPKDLWQTINNLLTESRRKKMLSVAEKRTNHIRLTLQDVHNEHNISACLRSAEALGIAEIDIISFPSLTGTPGLTSTSDSPPPLAAQKTTRKFRPTSVACGIAHWLTIRHFDSEQSYGEFLAANNTQLYAAMPAHPTEKVQPLENLAEEFFLRSLTTGTEKEHSHPRLAVLFGNERHGVDERCLNLVSGIFTIPTAGFAESMNVSVAAAITLHHLTWTALKNLGPRAYYLNSEQKTHLLNDWVSDQIASWPAIYKKLKGATSTSSAQTRPSNKAPT